MKDNLINLMSLGLKCKQKCILLRLSKIIKYTLPDNFKAIQSLIVFITAFHYNKNITAYRVMFRITCPCVAWTEDSCHFDSHYSWVQY